MSSLILEKEYLVHVYETGPDGKLTLYSLFNYMQDIASDHAIRLGFGRDDLMKNNRFWVLSRIYAVIDCLPSWEENIIITTWPNGTDKIFALRNYEVRYPDGRHIASGTSSWLILDRTTKKVQRPDSELTRFNSFANVGKSPIRYPGKIDNGTSGEPSASFRVKLSDLDVNLHTNNVRYLNWAMDNYSLDFVLKNQPQSAEINYLAESLFNDEIHVRTATENGDGSVFYHTVLRNSDNKELCRIKIGWKNNHK